MKNLSMIFKSMIIFSCSRWYYHQKKRENDNALQKQRERA
jgi:hypothetical protein